MLQRAPTPKPEGTPMLRGQEFDDVDSFAKALQQNRPEIRQQVIKCEWEWYNFPGEQPHCVLLAEVCTDANRLELRQRVDVVSADAQFPAELKAAFEKLKNYAEPLDLAMTLASEPL
jgi:hypothetical protein